jgi:Co/Zn/Cd efflux system component
MENSAVARLVHETLWGYPVILSGHAVGMAILVGIVLMINFRVLGFAPAVPVAAMRPMFKVALAGLAINVVSGSMLFMASANRFFESNPFRVKAVLLVIGGVLLWATSRQWFRAGGSATATGSEYRVLAGISVAVWIGVIVAGRLIAYLDVAYF